MDDLNIFRSQIDEVDKQLFELLAKRFSITNKVGLYKKLHNLPAVDKSREDVQFARIEKLSNEYDLDPEFSKAMLRLIIDTVVKNHKKIQSQK